MFYVVIIIAYVLGFPTSYNMFDLDICAESYAQCSIIIKRYLLYYTHATCGAVVRYHTVRVYLNMCKEYSRSYIPCSVKGICVVYCWYYIYQSSVGCVYAIMILKQQNSRSFKTGLINLVIIDWTHTDPSSYS